MARIPPSTTQERKCGRYEIVWMAFLYLKERISFRKRAKIIGSGNPINSLIKLMPSVFLMTLTKSSSSRNSLKCVSPTQGASAIDFTML
ncbi:hypothetical protein D3C73_1364000 [compost metagenome]